MTLGISVRHLYTLYPIRQVAAVVPLVLSRTHPDWTRSSLFGSDAHAYARADANPCPHSHPYERPDSNPDSHRYPYARTNANAYFQPNTSPYSHTTLQCVRRCTVGMGWREPNLHGVPLLDADSHPKAY